MYEDFDTKAAVTRIAMKFHPEDHFFEEKPSMISITTIVGRTSQQRLSVAEVLGKKFAAIIILTTHGGWSSLQEWYWGNRHESL